MNDKICIPSRYYGEFRVLTQMKDDWWEIIGLLRYMRFISDPNTGTIHAVDPDGGPFLSLGQRLYSEQKHEYVIEEIKSTGHMRLRKQT